MSRNSRTLQLEHLEQRELLSVNSSSDFFAPTAYGGSMFEGTSHLTSNSIAGPTAEEQEMLELINRMRIDPQGELNQLFRNVSTLEAWDSRVTQAIRAFSYPRASDLTNEWRNLQSCAPLAWDFSLYVAATNHSFQMIQADEQSHQFPGELSLYDRIVNAGFDPAQKYNEADGKYYAITSENVYAYGRDASGAYSAASYTHAAFAIDWGVPSHSHRDNIMNPEFTHVGISMLVETNPSTTVGPYVTTIDFSAMQNSTTQNGAYLLGVIFDDYNLSGYYNAGEGINNVQISILRLEDSLDPTESVEPMEFSPFQAGGYQIYLENGNYAVSVSGPSFSGTVTKYIAVQGENVKVDFTPQDCSGYAPILDLNGSFEGIHHEISFRENGSTQTLISDQATLEDQDSYYLSYVVITIENRLDGGNEYLCVDTSQTGLSSVYDSSTGVLLIFGDASVNDYLSVLKTVEYGNAALRANLSDRSISFVVSDGINHSEIAKSTVHIVQQTFETLVVADVQIEEGDQQTQEMVFHFELSDVPRCEVLVEYVFVDDTAIRGTHYFAENGMLRLQADQKTASVRVTVPGDYAPGEDITFYLQITGIYGAQCARTSIAGTIWDDDTPQRLGSRKSWSGSDLDLTDARRRLYSFEPSQNGVIFWEAVFAEGNRDDFVMELYITSHEGEPLIRSFEFNGRERIAWEVEKGETYIVLVRGENIVLNSLKMAFSPLSEDIENKSLQIQLDPNNNDRVTIDRMNNMLQYNGVNIPVQFADYDNIWFQNVAPNHVLQIVVPDQGQSGIFELNPEIPGENGNLGNVNIDDFQRIEYIVSNSSNVVRLLGTQGDDRFDFEDGIAQWTTSNGKIFTIRNGKIFDVQGNGGIDKAYIFDTQYSDIIQFGSQTANFLGGGSTGYDISVCDFAIVDISSFYGGLDTIYIVNENDSSTFLNERMIRRSEFDATRGVERIYYARGVAEAILSNAENSDSTIYLEGGLGENAVYITPGQLISTDEQRSYYHVIYGEAKIEWIEKAFRSNTPKIFYNAPSEVNYPYWIDEIEQGTLFVPDDVENSTIVWTAMNSVFQYFYYNGEKRDIQSLALSESSDFALLDAAQNGVAYSESLEELQNQKFLPEYSDSATVFIANPVANPIVADFDSSLFSAAVKDYTLAEELLLWNDWFDDEMNNELVFVQNYREQNKVFAELSQYDWYQLAVRSLSLADLALIYEDWNPLECPCY